MIVSPVTTEPIEASGDPWQRPDPKPVGFDSVISRISGFPGQTTQAAPANATHTVKSGESLWEICRSHLTQNGKSPAESDVYTAVLHVAKTNRLRNPDVLSVGQQLDLSGLRGTEPPAPSPHESPLIPRVPSPKPTLLKSESVSQQVTSQQPLRVASQPKVQYRSTAVGGAVPPSSLFARMVGHPAGEVLAAERSFENAALTPAARSRVEVTGAQKSVDVTTLMQSILEPGSVSTAAATTPASWSRLLGGVGELTSKFGMRKDPMGGGLEFHEGIDLGANPGTRVFPLEAGTVKFAGWQPGLGRAVIIDHGGGFETVYGHASESLVKVGQHVTPDTAIAKVGSTGRSTGPHLHFEARRNGKAFDPLTLFSEPSLYIAKAL